MTTRRPGVRWLAWVLLLAASACSSSRAEPPEALGGESAGGSSGVSGTTGGSASGGTAGAAGNETSGSGGGLLLSGAGGAGGGAAGAAAGGSAASAPAGNSAGGVTGGGSGVGGLGGAGGGAGGAAGLGGGSGGGAGGRPSLLERTEVLRVMRLVADHYLASFGTTHDNSWIRAAFYDGVLATYRTTLDEKYLTATKTWGAQNQWLVSTANSNGPRHADNQACFQAYAETYLTDPAPTDAMLASAVSVLDTMVASPRAGRSEWSWCDALFMAPPALARVAAAKGKPAYVTLLHSMWWDTHAFLYNPARGLFYRDDTARAADQYWSRGNGWVVGGTVRVLEYLPENDVRRSDYERLLREMAGALRLVQNQDDGLWRSDLKNPAAYPNPESSGTAFFCYGIAWGVHHGVLDRTTYEPVALAAWNGLVSVALTSEGVVGWVQTVARAPGPAARLDTQDYAAGAFLLAASEMITL